MAAFLDRLLFGGKYEKELKDLQQKVAREPKNLRLRVRVGDVLEKLGKRTEAIEAYRGAAEEYARTGMLIQAISLNKILLRLDPTQSKIHNQLVELYAQWGKPAEEIPGLLEPGKSPPAAAPPGPFPPIPLFSDLSRQELTRVMEKIQAKRFAAGKTICREGEAGNSLYIISHGKVAVSRRQPGRGRIVLNELKAGDFFGEFAYFSNARRQATVEALEDTEVLEMNKDELQRVVEEFPAVSKVLFKFYKERVLDNLLAASALFQTFPPEERREILEEVTLEEFPAGASVIEEGAPGDCLYIIKSGEVEVFTLDPKKEKLILATLQEGDYFGEISLITGRPRTASVKVLRAAELARLGKSNFDRIVARHPETLKVLEDSLETRLENKLRMLGVFRHSPAKEGMV
ncbi:MAG: cyclic nucleotide-binding domain-containing protein [Planctomycetaceae bacterium]